MLNFLLNNSEIRVSYNAEPVGTADDSTNPSTVSTGLLIIGIMMRIITNRERRIFDGNPFTTDEIDKIDDFVTDLLSSYNGERDYDTSKDLSTEIESWLWMVDEPIIQRDKSTQGERLQSFIDGLVFSNDLNSWIIGAVYRMVQNIKDLPIPMERLVEMSMIVDTQPSIYESIDVTVDKITGLLEDIEDDLDGGIMTYFKQNRLEPNTIYALLQCAYCHILYNGLLPNMRTWEETAFTCKNLLADGFNSLSVSEKELLKTHLEYSTTTNELVLFEILKAHKIPPIITSFEYTDHNVINVIKEYELNKD